MSLSRAARALPSIVVLLASLGCARGGADDVRGRGDAGTVARDAGGGGMDAGGTTPIDAGGTIPIDAGGTTPIDAGGTTPIDAGGMMPIDAGGGSCTESPCRLVAPQCGCPAGQACYSSGATRACAPAGTGAEGAACTSSSSCSPGLECLDLSTVAGVTAMQCARYCATDAECVGAGSICIHMPTAGVRLCSRACDPVRQTGCASGLTCNVYQESAAPMRFLTDCTGPLGSGSGGSACSFDSDCARGHACVSGMCLRWCNVATEEPCGIFELCEPLSPAVIVGATEYGVCF